MPMDPLVALGLAANIVQFFDFTWNLFSEAHKIHRSATGASDENDVLEILSTDLRSLTTKLQAAPATAGPELQNIALVSHGIANKILDALNDIKAKGRKGRWSSFVAALKCVWEENKIKDLVSRLAKAQQQLVTHLLVIFDTKLDESNNRQSEIITMISTMELQNMSMGLDNTKELQRLREQVLNSVQELQNDTQQAWTAVRALTDSVQQMPNTQEEPINALSDQLHTLSVQVSNLSLNSQTSAFEQAILQSLSFRSMRVRQSEIKDAFPATFDWIFESRGSGHVECFFRRWLEHESGIFWIEGKPGSGKSTMMNYLCSNSRTKELLKIWAKGRAPVISQYFFWNAGSSHQKSQEGLLQTLLYDILRQCPRLIGEVFPSRCHSHLHYRNSNDGWTKSELIEGFHKLLELKIGVDFCLFVDGLDEYDGDYSDLVDAIDKWPQSREIKICLSSRPRTVFRDAFGQDPKRTIKLEELTKTDIQKYVHGRLNMHKRFSFTTRRHRLYDELVDEIVEKAHGVFLWVFLVVKDLLQGVTNADSMPMLHQRLNEIPPELEAYFQQILDSIEKRYQGYSAVLFQTALAAAEPLSLLTYSLIDQGVWELPPGSIVSPAHKKEITEAEDDMRRRLDARCMSLLEITACRSLTRLLKPTYTVDFLHRTVRDFLQGREMQALLDQRTPKSFNARRALVQVNLFKVKQIAASRKRSRHDLECAARFIDEMIHYARAVEVQNEVTELHALNEAEALMPELFSKLRMGYEKKQVSDMRNIFIGSAVCKNLQLFIACKLKSEPELLTSFEIPLLEYALFPKHTSVLQAFDGKDWQVQIYYPSEMVRLLLEHGASPIQPHPSIHQRSQLPIWTVFMSHWGMNYTLARRNDRAEGSKLFPIVALFLQHGASLQDDVEDSREVENVDNVAGTGLDAGYRTEYFTRPIGEILYHWFNAEQQIVLRALDSKSPGGSKDMVL